MGPICCARGRAVLNLQQGPIPGGYAQVLPWESGPRFFPVGNPGIPRAFARTRATAPAPQFLVQDEEKGRLILQNAFKGYQDVKTERHGSQTTRGGGLWLDSHDCTGGAW